MVTKVGSLYGDPLNDFSFKEKIEILNRPKIEIGLNVIAGIDYERNKIDELFLKHVDKFIKNFFFTTKREKMFNHHLGKTEQYLYTEIWKKNEKIKNKKGKYNLRDAVILVLDKEDLSLSEFERNKYYDRVKKYMSNHKIKTLVSWMFYLGNIGYSLKE